MGDRVAPSWLNRSVGRALHWYQIGHGLESRSSLKFFQAFLSITAQVEFKLMINHLLNIDLMKQKKHIPAGHSVSARSSLVHFTSTTAPI